jgi:hypothetical protein
VTCAVCGRPCVALAAVLDRLARLEAGAVTRRLSRADRERLERLLPVIAAAVASDGFLVSELLRLESPGLRLVVGASSARSLGRLLRRAEGVPVGGYVVERLGQEGGAVLWRVLKVVC